MRFSREMAGALQSVDDHLEPGERVPDRWNEFPERLRDRLKASLAGSPTVRFEKAFAEFVQAHLMFYRRHEPDGSGRPEH